MVVLTAILGALEYRDCTGKGQHIDISQLESSLHFLAPPLLDYSLNNHLTTRDGNRHRHAAPHGIYPCKGEDRWCAIAVFTDDQWHACCWAMENPPWSTEPRFATLTDRKQNEDELDCLIASWTLDFSPQEVMGRMQKAGIPCGAVQSGPDLLTDDHQLIHRNHAYRLDHPEMGDHITERAPFRLSATPSAPRWAAPCLGEHNEYVCKQILKMTDKEFLDLFTCGVFG